MCKSMPCMLYLNITHSLSQVVASIAFGGFSIKIHERNQIEIDE